jgi:hypothetical protein
MPKTAAIIVNYNGSNDTIECVESLLDQFVPTHKIIIVDNYSPNNDYEILKEKFASSPSIVVLKSLKNGGFAYGNNFGIKYAMENSFKFYYFTFISGLIRKGRYKRSSIFKFEQ